MMEPVSHTPNSTKINAAIDDIVEATHRGWNVEAALATIALRVLPTAELLDELKVRVNAEITGRDIDKILAATPQLFRPRRKLLIDAVTADDQPGFDRYSKGSPHRLVTGLVQLIPFLQNYAQER